MSGPSGLSSAGAPDFRRRAVVLRRAEDNEVRNLRLPTLLGRWSDRVGGIGRGCTKGPVKKMSISNENDQVS